MRTWIVLVFSLFFAIPAFADMKAVVTDFRVNDSDARYEISLTYFNQDGTGGGQEVVFGIDVPYTGLTTDAMLHNAILSAVVADALQRGYTGFTTKDVKSTGIPFPTFHEAQISQGVLSPVIDGLTQGDHLLNINNSGRTMLVTQVRIIVVGISGAGGNPGLSIGKTASNYDDVISTLSLTGMNTANRFRNYFPDNDAVLINDGESLYLRVATAGAKTQYDFRAHFTGVFLD